MSQTTLKPAAAPGQIRQPPQQVEDPGDRITAFYYSLADQIANQVELDRAWDRPIRRSSIPWYIDHLADLMIRHRYFKNDIFLDELFQAGLESLDQVIEMRSGSPLELDELEIIEIKARLAEEIAASPEIPRLIIDNWKEYLAYNKDLDPDQLVEAWDLMLYFNLESWTLWIDDSDNAGRYGPADQVIQAWIPLFFLVEDPRDAPQVIE